MSEPVVLEVKSVSRYFGGVKAVENVDLTVPHGSITSLIGPNGAGKTTLFNVITCIFPATRGEVVFHPAHKPAQVINDLRTDEITCLGIARTFQNIRLFSELSALENVKLGAHAPTETARPLDRMLHLLGRIHMRMPWLGFSLLGLATAVAIVMGLRVEDHKLAEFVVWLIALTVLPMTAASILVAVLGMLEAVLEALPLPRTRKEEQEIASAALAYLDFVGLLKDADEIATNLAYGDQRRLEIARALACHPQLLLLDEPAAGMNPQETEQLMALIEKIRQAGITVLLIEHDMKLVMRISDLVYVLDHGELIASGTPDKVSGNPKVIEAYLGVSDDE